MRDGLSYSYVIKRRFAQIDLHQHVGRHVSVSARFNTECGIFRDTWHVGKWYGAEPTDMTFAGFKARCARRGIADNSEYDTL